MTDALGDARTQADLVAQEEQKVFQPEVVADRLFLPGIDKLHEKSTKEIAEVLANVLRSRANIREITYKVGEYIEIKSAPQG
jgi:hypothetical protein